MNRNRKRSRGHVAILVLSVSSAWLLSMRAHAWIYPEHREIGVAAQADLSGEAQTFYEALWRRAHFGYSAGLCEHAFGGQGAQSDGELPRSPCIDLPALPAIAGDHACSPQELVEETLPSFWIHDVARVGQEIREALAGARTPGARENVWFTSNLDLQAVDKGYVTRAGANNAHFLLPLTGDTLREFLEISQRRGAPLNALGLYVYYHSAALKLAAAVGPDPSRAPSSRVRRLLAIEAFALHFLEDMFSSGHIAGTWGDDATRKGTHDYYSAHGYTTTSWAGKNLIMYGDAHMRAADERRSAKAVADSWQQVFAAAAGHHELGAQADQLDRESLRAAQIDSCKLLKQPSPVSVDPGTQAAMLTLLAQTPRPGYGPESAAWPRYRADFGTFLGIVSSIALGGATGGFGSTGYGRGLNEFAVGLRLGYGLEGVLSSLNTGTMYLQIGLARQSQQFELCSDDCPGLGQLGSEQLPRVPSRGALDVELRMPFWLIPGDLLILAPILALTSPNTLTQVAIRAASGGLIPWQRSFATGIGHMELVVGRVVGATFFGLGKRTRVFATPPPELNLVPEGQGFFIPAGVRSLMLTFPVFELTPMRTFAQKLTAALTLQLAYAIDIPFDGVYYKADGHSSLAKLEWDPAHIVMLKLLLQARDYL